MKKTKFVACLVLAFFLAGCSQTVSRPDGALNGALVGGGIGAGVGASKGGGLGAAVIAPIGMAIGATVGALVGGVIGYATSGERKQPPQSSSKIPQQRESASP